MVTLTPADDSKLVGKVAVVTGGASGIGAALVYRLAAAGAIVTVADVNDGEAAAVADAAGCEPGYPFGATNSPTAWTAQADPEGSL